MRRGLKVKQVILDEKLQLFMNVANTQIVKPQASFKEK